jgi:hypothetical protein
MSQRRTITLVTAAVVAVGLLDLPYGYYTLLRLMICGLSLFLLFGESPVRVTWQRWLTGGCAVLYNPIVPVRIGEKGIWIVLNLATVAWFWFLSEQDVKKGPKA